MRRGFFLVPVLLFVPLALLFFALRPEPPTSESDGEKTFDLTVERGAMTPDEIVVDEGDRVSLRVSSDTPFELHLHGYNLTREVEPGEPAELSFDATVSGRFEMEDEQRGEELGVLIVQPR